MNPSFHKKLMQKLKAESLRELETIQELWSGYGAIKRFAIVGGEVDSIIIKHVCPPSRANHPRGWNSDRSHQRKLKSYAVESAWYRDWSKQCDDHCKVPGCYAIESDGAEVYIALEDLDASGFPRRLQKLSHAELEACVRWLANFHATFLGQAPNDLWEIGTYWHLDTRPDEFERIEDKALKRSAHAIDEMLRTAKYQTLVHGDAKIANFCFSDSSTRVAAVDFQYVGGGCGMKDLAYFLGSCLDAEACARLEEPTLRFYFDELALALRKRERDIDAEAVEAEWRTLYAPAWADFSRFLTGWSPGHWKLNAYEKRLTREVIRSLDR